MKKKRKGSINRTPLADMAQSVVHFSLVGHSLNNIEQWGKLGFAGLKHANFLRGSESLRLPAKFRLKL